MNSHRTSDDVMQRCLKLQIARCRAECRSFAPKIAKNADWVLTTAPACGIIIDVAGSNTPGRHMEYAAVAHLVERHLAKVEVASSSLVGRSNTKPSLMQKCKDDGFFVPPVYSRCATVTRPAAAKCRLPLQPLPVKQQRGKSHRIFLFANKNNNSADIVRAKRRQF